MTTTDHPVGEPFQLPTSDLPAVTAEQMPWRTGVAVDEYGIDPLRMMENAGSIRSQPATSSG